ncbi:MAG: CHAD domain-containing protein [Sideroxydans sp.]|nr:CHAD domain-containing protein [Sideroxydans sp.]
MAVETELKLFIAPEHLDRLKRHPLLKTLGVARAATQRLYSVYYDTPQLTLHDKAMALRLRRVGKQWLQTLKGGGGVQAGLHRRNEWEVPVAGEVLDCDALKACGGKLPKGVRKQLQPVFVTDFSRNVRLLHFEGAEIELCLDRGEIRAGKAMREVSELELELKSGEPQQLFRLALMLLEIVPLEVEHTSKAEYGYRLFSAAQPAVRKATFPHLDTSQDIATALQDMIGACLLHVQANVPGAILHLDEEFLHQVRVGLRRLRVVLAMAETFRADAELSALHEQVAELCVEFGRLREWDVFVTQTLEQMRARLPDHAGLCAVLEASGKQRAQHHAAVVRRFRSPDYQRLLLRFGAWLYGDYWRAPVAGAGLGLQDFAVRMLEQRSKQVGKRGKHLAVIEAGRLHQLRIACKKLRYSAEMFGSLFAGGKVKSYVALLADLQDILGLLNDIAVAHRLLDAMEKQHETLALIRGWLEHERAVQMARLDVAWDCFCRAKKFWG